MAKHRSNSDRLTEDRGAGSAPGDIVQEVPVTIFAPAHMTAGPNLTWPSQGLIDHGSQIARVAVEQKGVPEARWFQVDRSPSDIFHWRAYCERLVDRHLGAHRCA